jgi:hypothetical protein
MNSLRAGSNFFSIPCHSISQLTTHTSTPLSTSNIHNSQFTTHNSQLTTHHSQKMSYTSRVRYKNRRDRLNQHGRNFRLIILFAFLIALVLMFRNRYSIYEYIRTYFY